VTEATAPALEIDGVSHSYGTRRALSDVSFTVERGRFAALLGVNGAGKTTLFNLVTRLFDMRAGRIRVCGHSVRDAPTDALARLGVVFQSRALDANLTIAQNIVYHGALHGMRRSEALFRGRVLMERVRLSDRMNDKVGELSGGQVRRAEIARAMLSSPSLLLCDEATVGLDVMSRADIVADVHRLAAEERIGVLWATHLIDEVRPGDDVIVLHEGSVRATGTVEEIAGDAGLDAAFRRLTGAEAAA